jgi:Protein of unknown function (DUF4065)
MSPLSRNATVLRFLLEAAPGVGRIKLAKYAYLSDLEAVRHLGRSITNFRYIFDNHGPFDRSGFYTAIDEMKSAGVAIEQEVQYPGGYRGYAYTATQDEVQYDFTVEEAEILRYVAETYLGFSSKDLCEEVVYQTEPMTSASCGSALKMDLVARDVPDSLGFQLSAMLSGESAAKAGKHRPFLDAVRELQARHRA